MALFRIINNFYRTSTKLTQEQHRTADALKMKPLSFKSIFDKKSNSLLSSVSAIVENYKFIVQHLTLCHPIH